jgi:very-short-patch-repair endonuclease
MPVRHYRNIRNKAKPWKKRKAAQMARNQTWPEKKLWTKLRDKQLGAWFYKQKIVLGYIVDFWCPSAGIAIEVDGKSHRKRKAYDAKRDAVLRRKGIITMRFTNSAVCRNAAAVAAMIKAKVKQRLK